MIISIIAVSASELGRVIDAFQAFRGGLVRRLFLSLTILRKLTDNTTRQPDSRARTIIEDFCSSSKVPIDCDVDWLY